MKKTGAFARTLLLLCLSFLLMPTYFAQAAEVERYPLPEGFVQVNELIDISSNGEENFYDRQAGLLHRLFSESEELYVLPRTMSSPISEYLYFLEIERDIFGKILFDREPFIMRADEGAEWSCTFEDAVPGSPAKTAGSIALHNFTYHSFCDESGILLTADCDADYDTVLYYDYKSSENDVPVSYDFSYSSGYTEYETKSYFKIGYEYYTSDDDLLRNTSGDPDRKKTYYLYVRIFNPDEYGIVLEFEVLGVKPRPQDYYAVYDEVEIAPDTSPEDYLPYSDDSSDYGDEGLPPLAIALLAAGGVAVLGGGTVIAVRIIRKKPSAPIPKQETPEVCDWQGNKIDENKRVQQKHNEYTQANRDAQAEYDARRRAEEAARRQHEAQQDMMLEELMRISQRLSTTTRDASWKMNEITRKQIESAISGGELNPETVNRIKDGFGKLAVGDIIGTDDIPPMPTNAQLAIRAYEDAFEEVCRNKTATAAAARTISSVLSGGASDKFFQAGKALYRMKDYIDAGGDSKLGAATYALFGEARDRAVNSLSEKVMWKLPLTPKGKSLPKKIMYDQRKRYVKQVVNAADKKTAGTDDKALKLIRQIFE